MENEKKPIKPEDNSANQQNSNSGTKTPNEQNQKARDNRANQMNPNHDKTKGK